VIYAKTQGDYRALDAGQQEGSGMLKNKGAILAFLGLVSLIPIGYFYPFIAPHDIYRDSHEYKTYNPFNDEYFGQSAERVAAHYTKILDEITMGLLVVGFAQAILFLWQLSIINKSLADTKEAADAARDSAKASGDAVTLARQSAETQLRAYMSVTRATISNVVVDKIPEIEIETINSGQTPAYKACITYKYCLAYFPFREEITQPEKESSSTIGPGSLFWRSLKAKHRCPLSIWRGYKMVLLRST
jgi:hypothetical protein